MANQIIRQNEYNLHCLRCQSFFHKNYTDRNRIAEKHPKEWFCTSYYHFNTPLNIDASKFIKNTNLSTQAISNGKHRIKSRKWLPWDVDSNIKECIGSNGTGEHQT